MQHQKVGVTKYGQRYRTQLNRKGKIFYLGVHATEEEAARAYDRGSILTEAWSRRVIALNYGRPEKPPKPESSEEKTMLVYLQTYFPDDIAQFNETREINGAVPSDQLERLVRHCDLVQSSTEQVRISMATVRNAFVSLKVELTQTQQKLEYAERMYRELQVEMQTLKSLPPPPTYTMRRIMPLPPASVPVEPVQDSELLHALSDDSRPIG